MLRRVGFRRGLQGHYRTPRTPSVLNGTPLENSGDFFAGTPRHPTVMTASTVAWVACIDLGKPTLQGRVQLQVRIWRVFLV